MSELEKPVEVDRSTTDENRHHSNESFESLMGFRLTPRPGEIIHESVIKMIIRRVYHDHLDGKTWDDLDLTTTCKTISRAIKDGVQDFCLHSIRKDFKYKYIVETFIGKFYSQSMTVQTRCLWDKNTDRLVSENYINDSVICSSQVIFIYFYWY